jgi:hypothetical protein
VNGHGHAVTAPATSFGVASTGKTGYCPTSGYHPMPMQYPGQGSIFRNYISAESFSDNCLSSILGPISTQTQQA